MVRGCLGSAFAVITYDLALGVSMDVYYSKNSA